MLADAKRDGRKLVMLTAYDAGFARVLDDNGVDLVLVGDSLGMVVQGHDSTLPVTVDDIVYHTACVARGLHARAAGRRPAVPGRRHARARARRRRCAACRRARRWSSSKARATSSTSIRFLVEREIPVCAHLGLTPQSVLRLGGYKVQGRETRPRRSSCAPTRARSPRPAPTLLVLECVPRALAAAITAAMRDPHHRHRRRPATATARCWCCTTCSASNTGHRRPKFVKDFLAEGGSIAGAVAGVRRRGARRQLPRRRARLRLMHRMIAHRARRAARARRRVEARGPARRLRADHGQPARRPPFAGRAGARARRPRGRQRVRQSDPVRAERGLRALPAHARGRRRGPGRAPAATLLWLPSVETMYPYGADGARADARARRDRHARRRAPPRPFRRRGARWSRACSTRCSRTSPCSAARITSSWR